MMIAQSLEENLKPQISNLKSQISNLKVNPISHTYLPDFYYLCRQKPKL